MFRIRRVYDYTSQTDKDAIEQAKLIFRTQFPGASSKELRKLAEQLRNPLKYRFRSIIFVAEGAKRHINGFAVLLHEAELKFCYLDYISTTMQKMGRGIGSALYERVRDEALFLGSTGLFFECLPDDPKLCPDTEIRKQNAARLRFYERYGARPIANTAYETPVDTGDYNSPYLVFDDLGQGMALERTKAQLIVRAILERKYGDICSPEYVQMVVDSFQDDPVQLRAPQYIKTAPQIPLPRAIPTDRKIIFTVNDKHWIHHIEEVGYVESPVRIDSIIDTISKSPYFQQINPRTFSERHITAVHDRRFFDYLKRICASLEEDHAVYPYTFPVRNRTRPPHELLIRAGYYCIDTFTPLNHNVFPAAKRAVDCALTMAEKIREGYSLAYALVRPPGHHAEINVFGGFCYFNSTAIAANYLSALGKVAILDIDYHHGNGQQEIFYDRADVLTISIHGHPSFAYPYFSGFAEEHGVGAGTGFNINYPLSEKIDSNIYMKALTNACNKIARFRPKYLVVALGLDTSREDPTGTWNLAAADFESIGRIIGALRYPTLIVQEGGYDTRVLGTNALSFLEGLWSGSYFSREI